MRAGRPRSLFILALRARLRLGAGTAGDRDRVHRHHRPHRWAGTRQSGGLWMLAQTLCIASRLRHQRLGAGAAHRRARVLRPMLRRGEFGAQVRPPASARAEPRARSWSWPRLVSLIRWRAAQLMVRCRGEARGDLIEIRCKAGDATANAGRWSKLAAHGSPPTRWSPAPDIDLRKVVASDTRHRRVLWRLADLALDGH